MGEEYNNEQSINILVIYLNRVMKLYYSEIVFVLVTNEFNYYFII